MSKNRLDFKANLSRHSHDVSAGYTSTMSCGMIIPQYFDILGPGDSIYYRTHMFARMQDVVTAFLGEVDLHIDYFFVPLQMIYTPFGQIFAQTDDFVSSLYSSMSVKDTFPTIGIDHTFVVNTAYNTGGVSEFECEGKKIMRMLDAFDMNPYEVIHNDFFPTGYQRPASSPVTIDSCYNPPVAPWIPCAYQAIYQKYYRNDEFEKLDVDSYNVDKLYNASEVTLNKKYFDLNWCQRPSDYFTKTRISPISSAVNSLGQSSQFPDNGGSLGEVLYKVDSFLTTHDLTAGAQPYGSSLIASNDLAHSFGNTGVSSYAPYATAGVGSEYTYLNAANIRALFAVDKFSRIYGRADKTYDDQILAHFGIEIPHDVKHDLTHLKHYHMVIQSDPIYGTANTALADNSKFIGTIGQVGGQGQAVIDTDQEKFTAPVHGVFMAVAYVVTKPRYTNTFSKLHLCTNRLAFPIPEYDKLGAQPLYAFEFSRVFLRPNGTDQSAYRSIRRGWQNRYQQFKEKYNRASVAFERTSDEWTPGSSVDNIYSSWVVNRAPFELEALNDSSRFLDPVKFFENPHNLDSIMVRPYVSSWSNDYFATPHLTFQTDPLITEFMCFAKKVSWMSETGEPDL